MLQFINCIFHRNYAGFSGGVAYLDTRDGDMQLRIKNSYFKDNKAELYGGAIAMRGMRPIVAYISNSNFNENEGKKGGGAIAAGASSPVISLFIERCKFRKNKTHQDGGGIFLIEGRPFELRD